MDLYDLFQRLMWRKHLPFLLSSMEIEFTGEILDILTTVNNRTAITGVSVQKNWPLSFKRPFDGDDSFWAPLLFLNVKVVLWSKFYIPLSLHFWEVEVLSTYHAKFYLKIRMGSEVILTLFLGFGRPPLLDSKMTECIKKELALVTQIGSAVIFASQGNIVANFLCNSDKWDLSKNLFWCLKLLKCLQDAV